MSAYNTDFKQEMPPKGGYTDVNYKRVLPKRIVNYKAFFFASCIFTIYGQFYYYRRNKYLSRMKTDYMDYLIAVEPIALAEQDRAYLRQLRHNRNTERDLMKNVPDWQVGTLWGKSVYNKLPENALPNLSLREFYGHRPQKEAREFGKPSYQVGLDDNDLNGV